MNDPSASSDRGLVPYRGGLPPGLRVLDYAGNHPGRRLVLLLEEIGVRGPGVYRLRFGASVAGVLSQGEVWLTVDAPHRDSAVRVEVVTGVGSDALSLIWPMQARDSAEGGSGRPKLTADLALVDWCWKSALPSHDPGLPLIENMPQGAGVNRVIARLRELHGLGVLAFIEARPEKS